MDSNWPCDCYQGPMAAKSGKTGKLRALTRRDALLQEAARQINELGAGAVSINALADAVGLSRNALYYYVADRADLVFQCYLRSCERTTEDLAIALDVGETTAACISRFVELSMNGEQSQTAVLGDQDFLPEPHRTTIAGLNQHNVDTLTALIADGIRSGEFRPVNARTAAQALMGIVNWARLSANWLGHRSGPAARKRAADAASDLFLNGISISRESSFGCTIRTEQLVTRTWNPFDREQAAEQRIAQLTGAASALFNRRGLDGTSLDDIGMSVGATKGAVYHYFDDKAALIISCYERAFALYEKFIAEAARIPNCGRDRSLMVMHLNCQAQAGPAPPLMLQPGIMSLPANQRDAFIARSNKLWKASSKLMKQGIKDRSCRPCDAALVSELSAGAFLWLPKWLPEDDLPDPVVIADEMCRIFENGISKR